MVNGVPREVTRPKPEGLQAPRVLAAGLSKGLNFTMIHPRLFHTFSFYRHPGLVRRDFFSNGVPSTTVSLSCLVMLQRVSRSYKGHQISEKFDTNEEVK